jgi:hypothetical protein
MLFTFPFILFSQLFACKGCQENEIIDQGKLQNETGFINDWGRWLDMTITRDGNPAVVYYDTTQGGIGIAIGTISGDSVSWAHEEIDGYPNEQGLDEGDRGLYASLEITQDDTIWVSYYDVGLKNLRYATRNSDETEWTKAIADSGSGSNADLGLYTDMTLDAEENPIIVHYDQHKKDLLIVHSDGSEFTSEIIDEGEDYVTESEFIEDDTGKFASIHTDNGVEYISYYDSAAGDLRLAWGTTGNYTLETIDSDGNVGQWTSLYIYNNTIYIAYHDVTNDQLKLAQGRPGNFTIEVIEQGNAIGADSELLVNENGIYIAYHDGYNNDIKMAAFNDGAWNISTLGGTETALGFHNELIDIDGTIFTACYNFTDNNVWFEQLP